MAYVAKRKKTIPKKTLPPGNATIRELAAGESVSVQTLYSWRKQTRSEYRLMPEKKIWLFSGIPNGARASAVWYSLIESAKASGLEPYAYLQHIIGNIASAETHEKRCFRRT